MVNKFFFIVILALMNYYVCNANRASTEPRIVLSGAQCGKREYYNECGSRCSPACRGYYNDCNECIAGCFCRKPFLRSTLGGPCTRFCPTFARAPKKPPPPKNMLRGMV